MLFVLALLTLSFAPVVAQTSTVQGQDSSPAAAQQPTATQKVVEPRLARVAVLGASVSAGMGLNRELHAEVDLAVVLDALIQSDSVVRGFGDNAFFMAPTAEMTSQIDSLTAFQPTQVLGVDLLFWFAYGARPESERLEYFKLGLSVLSKIEAPLLLGDIPDMSDSVQSDSLFSLKASYVPTKETREKMNALLLEWAEARENVLIIPVAEHVASLQGDKAVTLHGNSWKPGDLKTLLQPDLLHPTVDGSLCLGVLMLDTLHKHRALAEGAVEWDVKAARTELLALTAKEREAALALKAKEKAEREARRQQRKKERAERRKRKREQDGDKR